MGLEYRLHVPTAVTGSKCARYINTK